MIRNRLNNNRTFSKNGAHPECQKISHGDLILLYEEDILFFSTIFSSLYCPESSRLCSTRETEKDAKMAYYCRKKNVLFPATIFRLLYCPEKNDVPLMMFGRVKQKPSKSRMS